MSPIRLLTASLLVVASWIAAPSAQAQDKDVFTLRAAVGGAVPFAQKESYLIASLAGATQKGQLALADSLPFSRLAAPVFEARPQVVLNGSMDLGLIGPAAVSLNAYVSAGMAEPAMNTERPLFGLAALRLVF